MAADDSVPPIPTVEEDTGPFIPPEWIDLLRVGLLGLGVGLLIPLLSWVLHKFLVTPLFCREVSTLALCSPADPTTYYVATAIVGIIATALMANWQIFRPLLIVVAAAASLWGLQRFMGDTIAQSGIEYYLTSAALYMVAFLLFYWILRLKNFALSVVLTVAAVVLVRWVLLI